MLLSPPAASTTTTTTTTFPPIFNQKDKDRDISSHTDNPSEVKDIPTPTSENTADLSDKLFTSSEENLTVISDTPTPTRGVAEIGATNVSPGSISSGRGLVSRRGGRLGSTPTTSSPSSRAATASAFRPSTSTSMSKPQVMRNDTHPENTKGQPSADDTNRNMGKVGPKGIVDDAVPSLCSIPTVSTSSPCSPHSPTKASTDMKQKIRSPLHMNPQFDASAMMNTRSQTRMNDNKKNDLQPLQTASSTLRKRTPHSITVDPSHVTSPLHHDLKDVTPTKKEDLPSSDTNKPSSKTQAPPSLGLQPRKNTKGDVKKEESKETYSPVPSSENQIRDIDPRQTPNFGLLNFHDARSNSPSGLFLSPYSPLGIIGESPSFDRTPRVNPQSTPSGPSSTIGSRPSVTSSGKKSQPRDRGILATSTISSNPTTPRKSLDANPFSWLTSPSQGFFSPNPSDSGRAIGSAITTPTFSSMFFQDKGLTPLGPTSHIENEDKSGSAQMRDLQRHHPYSKMICISPLASSKKNHNQPRCKSTGDLDKLKTNTNEDTDKSRRKLEAYDDLLNVPLSSPTLHFDMHVAEKDLMEDEDLSVLLHLASNSNNANAANSHSHNASVNSRSPRPPPKKYHPHRPSSNSTPSSLQLPLMGGPEPGASESHFPPKLARMSFRKSSTSDQSGRSISNEFVPPSLPIRPTKALSSSNTRRPSLSLSSSGSGDRDHSGNVDKMKDKSNVNVKADSNPTKRIGTAPSESSKRNPSILSHPGPGPAPPRSGSYPAPNYPYPPGPGPHSRGLHPPPPGYHDGMNVNHNHGDRRPPPGPMQHQHQHPHHIPPPNGYPPPPPNGNPNPHLRGPSHGPPHTHAPGQMPPYHYPPPPPQHPHAHSGQYNPAPYTTLNQSHAKGKLNTKKNNNVAGAFGSSNVSPANAKQRTKKGKSTPNSKRGLSEDIPPIGKKKAKSTPSKKKGTPNKGKSTVGAGAGAAALDSGDKNAHAAALAAAILRGVTMRPSGKWQAQLYYAGKSRYIGVFDTREKAALAYEIAREKLKSDKSPDTSNQCIQDTEAAVSLARKAAFEGVNEPDPRPPHKR